MTAIRVALLGLQILFLGCAYMPGVEQPARGALMLISLWFFGVNTGLAWCARQFLKGGDC